MRRVMVIIGAALVAAALVTSASAATPRGGNDSRQGAVACLQGSAGARAVVVRTGRAGRMSVTSPGRHARALRIKARKAQGSRRVTLVRRAKALEARQRTLDATCVSDAPSLMPGDMASGSGDDLSELLGMDDAWTDPTASEPPPTTGPPITDPPPWVCDPRVTTACLPTPECYFAMYDSDPDADAICRRLPGDEVAPPQDPEPDA